MTLEELVPLKYLVLRSNADLWANVLSMSLDLNLPSQYVEPLYAIGSAEMAARGRLLAVHLFLIIKEALGNKEGIITRETVHFIPKFDPPKLFEKLLRPKRKLGKW